MIRLVTLDLDGTLLPDTTAFEVILRAAGRADDVAASDAKYFAGEQDLEATFWEQWDWIQELTLADLHRALRGAPWLSGIPEAITLLHDAGLRTCVLTDQPSTVTDYLGRWGLVDAVCSPVTVVEGKQTDVDGRFDKWSNLHGRLEAWGIDPSEVCHVGNGANDVPVWDQIGMGVAVFAPADVAAKADHVLTPTSLVEVVDVILSAAGSTSPP